jgi:hypothetical protein
LVILAESQRRNQSQGKTPALDLYAGVYFRVLKKYMREGYLKHVDVLILTKQHGLVLPDKALPYAEPSPGPAGKLDMSPELVEVLRKRNLGFLRKLLRGIRYDEIYVNVGEQYGKLLMGLGGLGVRITMAKGGGLGPKAKDMKEWIERQPR